MGHSARYPSMQAKYTATQQKNDKYYLPAQTDAIPYESREAFPISKK
jgi:hypothetical protein